MHRRICRGYSLGEGLQAGGGATGCPQYFFMHRLYKKVLWTGAHTHTMVHTGSVKCLVLLSSGASGASLWAALEGGFMLAPE